MNTLFMGRQASHHHQGQGQLVTRMVEDYTNLSADKVPSD